MPVRIRIDVNGKLQRTLWIGRMEGSEEEDSINTYVVGEGNEHLEAWNITSFDNLTHFKHRYGDGLEKCVERGIAAYMGDRVVKKPEPKKP